MDSTVCLTLGIVCVIAAIVGGGLKLLGIEIPPRQLPSPTTRVRWHWDCSHRRLRLGAALL